MANPAIPVNNTATEPLEVSTILLASNSTTSNNLATPVSGNTSSSTPNMETSDNTVDRREVRRLIFDGVQGVQGAGSEVAGGETVEVGLVSNFGVVKNSVEIGVFVDHEEETQEKMFEQGYDSDGNEGPVVPTAEEVAKEYREREILEEMLGNLSMADDAGAEITTVMTEPVG